MLTDALITPFTEFEFMRRALAAVIALSLGGAPIGDSRETGVLDPYHRMWGHPGISVVDGSAISANLGVNPALTITAQAERAFGLWPNQGEADPRPAPGGSYRVVTPIPPRQPMVPNHAPAALRVADGFQRESLSQDTVPLY